MTQHPKLHHWLLLIFLAIPLCASAAPKPQAANGKLKVFILSDQSNMVDFGQIEGSPGTMETYVKRNPKDYAHLVGKDGKPVVRDDVWIVNLSYLIGKSMVDAMVELEPNPPASN